MTHFPTSDHLPLVAAAFDGALASLSAALDPSVRHRAAIFGAGPAGRLAYGLLRASGTPVVAVFASRPSNDSGFGGLEVEAATAIASRRGDFDALLIATASASAAREMTDTAARLGVDPSAVIPLPALLSTSHQAAAPAPPGPIPRWAEDPEFQAALEALRPFAPDDHVRGYALYQWLRQTAGLRGELAEVAVHRGGTALLVARARLPRARSLHLFDVAEPNGQTIEDGTTVVSNGSLAALRRQLEASPCVHFHAGVFPDAATRVADRRFTFVHVDAAGYDAVRASCDFFYPRLVAGGVLLFDDYGLRGRPGARQAVDEFFAAKPEHPCYLATGQSVVVKMPE